MTKEKQAPEQLANSPEPQHPRWNEGLDLSMFNYTGFMVGDDFKAYKEITEGKWKENEYGAPVFIGGGLNAEKIYDFTVFKVTPVRRRLFPQSKDTTTVLNGFKFVTPEPVKVTAMPLKHAIELNRQLDATTSAMQLHYLLTKYPTDAANTSK